MPSLALATASAAPLRAARLAPRSSGRAGKGAGAGKGAPHVSGGRPARARERLPRGGRTREELGDRQERQQDGDTQAEAILNAEGEAMGSNPSKDDKVARALGVSPEEARELVDGAVPASEAMQAHPEKGAGARRRKDLEREKRKREERKARELARDGSTALDEAKIAWARAREKAKAMFAGLFPDGDK